MYQFFIESIYFVYLALVVLQMSNKNNKNGKPGHHDDCEDCRRQKKENEALIAIYERLQAVDNNSKLMRKSLEKHKAEFEATTSKFNAFVTKFNQVPKQSKTDIELKNLGYEFANSMVYEVRKGPVVTENQRLKSTLAQLYKPKRNDFSELTQNKRSLSTSTDRPQINESRVEELNKSIGKGLRRSFYKSFDSQTRYSPVEEIKEVRQPSETRTTGFFSNQNCNPKIQGLNLWLYEQKESKGLQQELYETRAVPKNRLNKATKSKGAVLPALRTTKNKI